MERWAQTYNIFITYFDPLNLLNGLYVPNSPIYLFEKKGLIGHGT